jgi:DNA-binding TFAR19-related protein (PDSD5 family)
MDEDIEDVRERRRKELENQSGEDEAIEEQREKLRQQAAGYLTSDAQSRLGNIRTADPEKASSIEMQIARLGEESQIDKINDEQLKDILQSISEEESKTDSDIKFRR